VKEISVDQIVNEERRTFLRRGAMGVGALWAVSLQQLSARTAFGGRPGVGVSPYGPVSPKTDETTGLKLLRGQVARLVGEPRGHRAELRRGRHALGQLAHV
jgi:hypothetical protein